MSAAHAEVVRHVFPSDDGWLVTFDHGEFGGGLEWYARGGSAPRSIVIGPHEGDEEVPQNVNQALTVGGDLYVLQGISHMGISEGQLAKVWREHDHFSSQVVARYASEPVDWIHEPDGTWLVATWNAIWRTSEQGSNELITRLPAVLDYPNSLAKSADGTLYVGGRGGILRLTPTWPDTPRYAADLLVPMGSREEVCRAERATAGGDD